MDVLVAGLFLSLLCVVLLLNLLSLPANWLVLVLVFGWRFVHPNPGNMDTMFFIAIVSLAILAEIIEFVTQGWGAKRYGSSTSGMWAGFLGAFVGAFIGLTFLFGFGALIGALLGAWLGCYGMERVRGRDAYEASRAAKGALVGRFLGIVIKCAMGVIMLGLVYNAIWPGLIPSMPHSFGPTLVL